MTRLTASSYGKCDVRLTKVGRSGERHSLLEYTVRILLGGAFDRVYTDGDNSSCIPTDTMKNTVYALAKTSDFDCPEEFAAILAGHFLTFRQVRWSDVSIEQQDWARITVGGTPHAHAFTRGTSGIRTARVRRERGGGEGEGGEERAAAETWGGVQGLEVLKTTRSGFSGFHRDRFTTLPETSDRILATVIDAQWDYHREAPPASLAPIFDAARGSLLETFATHDSASVQHTLYAMGEALLARCPAVRSVSLTMPNRHRLLFNLAPFGLENPNEIFVATSEPYGLISGSVSRE